MIRRAPVVVTFVVPLLAAILGYAEWVFVSEKFSDRLENARAEISRLQARIDGLQATIQYQDRVLTEVSSRRPSRSEGFAQLALSKFEILDDPKSTFLRANINIKNTGTLPTSMFTNLHTARIVESPFDGAGLDDVFHDMMSRFDPKRAPSTKIEIQPGTDDHHFTEEFKDVKVADFIASVRNGKKISYFMMILAYSDSALPPGVWRETEICMYTFEAEEMRYCSTHNRDVPLGD